MYIGIHKDGPILRMVSLNKKGGILTVDDRFEVDLKKQFANPSFFLPKKYSEKNVQIASIAGAEATLIKEKKLSNASKKDIQDAIPFQIEELIPYPEKEVKTSVKVFYMGKEGALLQVVGIQKKDLEEHLKILKEQKIEPEFVGNEVLALMEASHFLSENTRKKAIFYLGEEKALFIVCQEERILFSYVIPFSAKDSFPAESTPTHSPTLIKFMNRLIALKEEKKLFVDSDTPLFVFSKQMGIKKWIAGGLQLPLAMLPSDTQKDNTYVLALGAALQAAKKKHNLRTEEFLAPQLQVRKKSLLLQSMTYSLACSLLILVFSLGWKYFEEKRLSKLYAEITEEPLRHKSFDKLEEDILFCTQKIKKEKVQFTLLNTFPTVSDVLAYLSNHPILCERDPISGQGVEMISFHYNFPSENTLTDPKVEVRFLFPNADLLKSFSQKLETEENFINKSKSIQILPDGPNTCFTFYLKKSWIP